MIYRTLHENLQGLENEGAYLLMCKEVLPVGMLGLMLGGMIFATASSVNTTLNMSAAVFTNDIFKALFPQSGDRQLMRTARLSTVVLGLLTIGVALLVPAAGGIVEVVLSFGAITGVPLYGPPIWALFSRRQTATSIAGTTLLSIAIGLFFKLISPAIWGFSLDRASEMLVGTLVPLGLLAAFELYAYFHGRASAVPLAKETLQETGEESTGSDAENRFALRVMGFTLLATGVLIASLGIASTRGSGIVSGIGTVVLTAGAWLLFATRRS
jgi:Na+/proline symporter